MHGRRAVVLPWRNLVRFAWSMVVRRTSRSLVIIENIDPAPRQHDRDDNQEKCPEERAEESLDDAPLSKSAVSLRRRMFVGFYRSPENFGPLSVDNASAEFSKQFLGRLVITSNFVSSKVSLMENLIVVFGRGLLSTGGPFLF